jgi:hypothetical protein
VCNAIETLQIDTTMKIITDKINSSPSHSISKSDIEVILRNVTNERFGIATVFKISAQLFSNSGWERPVIKNGTTYNILSRGLERDFIIKEFLIEIYVHATDIHLSMKSHRLNSLQRKKLEETTESIFEKIVEELNSTKINKH